MRNQKNLKDLKETMRSYRQEQTGIENIKMMTEEIPSVQRGEVLVRVKATSLNYRDFLVAEAATNNFIPLSDGAGEIVAVGEGVRRFQVGDRVAGSFNREWFSGLKRPSYVEPYGSHTDGWLTEYKVIHPELLVRIPSHLTYEQAATLPCAAVTAWSALHGPRPLSAGDSILTLGSGGVSVFAIQFAALLGLNVIATTSSNEKAKRLKELGAKEVINYQETPNWGEVVKQPTGGLGVDRVVEVGGAATIHQSIKSLAPGGEISLIGVLTKSGEQIDYFDLFGKASVRTIQVGSRDDFESMNKLIESFEMVPVIDTVYPFEQAVDAMRYMGSQKHLGKVVIAHH